MKCALISGANGQDASYLSEILLEKDYLVVGINRRKSSDGEWRIKHLYSNPNFIVESGDLTDTSSISRLINSYMPDEVYNLGAMSFVGASWAQPLTTLDINAGGAIRCLEAIRSVKDQKGKDIKFYQASTSELFGKVQETPQRETTPHWPRSPYGISKEAAYWATINYRESYGIFACNGILFNHEGPRRGLEFVTRKITDAVARIKHAGGVGQLALGRLDIQRDWGHSRDYMEAAWLMLQQEKPDDYVIATGQTHTIEEFLNEAFGYVGLNWRDHVVQDEKFIRPAEVEILVGDASKALRSLGWKPTYNFQDLVREMVDADLERVQNDTK